MSDSQFSIKEVVTMREIAMTAAFIAMVFLSTSLFYIALVSSTGFFNIGEAFVYLAALIGGPIVGALAGGIGAAMADMVLGYGSFAPATLVLKGTEGFIAGFLYKKSREIEQKYRLLIIAAISLFLMAFSIFVTTPALNGDPGSSVISIVFNFIDYTLNIPGLIIVFLALIFCCTIWFVELKMGEKGQMILSCLLAGPIIVVGYFLYEVIFLSVPVGGALSEIPFNIAQVVFGIVIAVPIVSYLRELGIIHTKEKEKPSLAEQKVNTLSTTE